MSRFQSLDTVLAHDKNFREFFSALASGTSHPSSVDPIATALAEEAVAPTTTPDDFDTANTDAGPQWVTNSTSIAGDLVTETDFTQRWTTQNSHAPKVGTRTNWDFQGKKWTVATQGNIVAFAPSNFQHLANKNIDLKALLQAAAAHGLISGNEQTIAPGK